MRPIQALLSVVWVVSSCAGGSSGPPAAVDPAPAKDAPSFSTHGLQINRPEGWEFVAPDSSVMPDTVAILHGPLGDSDMRPAVEISRRELTVADRKRKPDHILTTVALEIAQTFAAFNADGNPQEIQVGGKPGASMKMTLTELLPDGAQADRAARFVVVVDDGQIWVIRCFGPSDGSAGEAFDAIVDSLSFSG